jgi:hypothetical protein
MKNLLRATALLLLASITFAFDRSISWTPPTFYVGGAPLLEQDLDFYTLYCDDVQLVTLDSIIGTWTATITFPDTGGTHTCWLTVTTLAGIESDPSNTYVFTNQPPARKPMAPVVVWP